MSLAPRSFAKSQIALQRFEERPHTQRFAVQENAPRNRCDHPRFENQIDPRHRRLLLFSARKRAQKHAEFTAPPRIERRHIRRAIPKCLMQHIGGNRSADHSRINPFPRAAGDKSRRIANQDRAAARQRLHGVDRAGRIERVIRIAKLQILRDSSDFPRTFHKSLQNGAYVSARTDAPADSHADVLALWKDPAIAIETVESERYQQRGLFSVKTLDALRRIRNVFIRTQHVLIRAPAFAESGPAGDLTVRTIGAHEEPGIHGCSIVELGVYSIPMLLQAHRADSLKHGGAPRYGNVRQSMIEFRSQCEIPGWLAFVIGAVTRQSLIVKADAVKRAVDKVGHLRPEVIEP